MGTAKDVLSIREGKKTGDGLVLVVMKDEDTGKGGGRGPWEAGESGWKHNKRGQQGRKEIQCPTKGGTNEEGV